MSKRLFGKHQIGSIARGGVWALSFNAVRGVFQLLNAIVLSRLVSPEHFGVFAVMLVFHAIVTSLLGNSLSTSLIQKQDLEEQEASNFFWFTAVIAGICALAFAATGPLISLVFNDPIYVSFAIVFAGLIWLDAVGAQYQALAMRSIRFDLLFWAQLLSMPIALIAGVWAALSGFGPWALVVHMACASILARFLLIIMIGWLPLYFNKATRFFGMVGFGARVSLGALTGLLYNRLPILFLTNAAGPAAAGYFNRGDALFNRPFQQAVFPISSLLLPSMSAATSDLERLRTLLINSIWLLALALGPLVAVMAVYGDWFAVILLGPRWVEAGEVVRWMAVMAIGTTCRKSLSSVNAALGRPARSVGLKIGLLPIFLVSLYLAAPRGAGFTSMVMALFYTGMLIPQVAILMRGLPLRKGPILATFASAYLVLAMLFSILFGLRIMMLESVIRHDAHFTDMFWLIFVLGVGYTLNTLLIVVFPQARLIVWKMCEKLVSFVRSRFGLRTN